MSITATELKLNLGRYLLLSRTEDINITKNGKPIARLTKPSEEVYRTDRTDKDDDTTVVQLDIQKKACSLINQLPEDSISALIEIMIRMLPSQDAGPSFQDKTVSVKRRAYLELQEIRKELSGYDFSEEDLANGLEEKYGTL